MIFHILAIFFPSEAARSPEPSVGEQMQAQLRNSVARTNEIIERNKLKDEARRKRELACIKFFTDGFNRLADTHAKELQRIGACASREQLDHINTFISQGQRCLVTQADLLYGERTVNSALQSCGYRPHQFRHDAFA